MDISKRIGVFFFFSLFFIIWGFLTSHAAEQTKVVVVPLFDSSSPANLVERFVNVETSYTWDCPPTASSVSLDAECPADCIAVGGACSAKDVADATDVTVTGGNFVKTNELLSKYNAFQCWMLVLSCSDSGDPPVGYAQVICYCNN